MFVASSRSSTRCFRLPLSQAWRPVPQTTLQNTCSRVATPCRTSHTSAPKSCQPKNISTHVKKPFGLYFFTSSSTRPSFKFSGFFTTFSSARLFQHNVPRTGLRFASTGGPGSRATRKVRWRPLKQPPKQTSNRDKNMRFIYGIIGLNIAVFAYKSKLEWDWSQSGNPAAFLQYYLNMTCGLGDVAGGRWYTILTCCFSHANLQHIAFNLVSFYFMSQFLAVTPGVTVTKLALLTIGSGLLGSIGFLFHHAYQYQQGSKSEALQVRCQGFSGAVMGVGAAAACMYPTSKILIWGVVPVPLAVMTIGYFVFDAWGLADSSPRKPGENRTAHAGHVGGAIFGFIYGLLRLRRLRLPML